MTDNNKVWISATTRYNQELSLRKQFIDNGIEHFIPTRTILQKRSGQMRETEKPIIPNLIFLCVCWTQAFELYTAHRNQFTYIRQQDRKILTIPDRQMDDFIRLVDEMKENVTVENGPYLTGDRVMIKNGPLAGIEGILADVNGKREFVLRIGPLLSVRVRIPRNNLIKIKNKTTVSPDRL